MIITTTDNIEGYKIVEYLGVIGQSEVCRIFAGTVKTSATVEALSKRAIKELNADALVGLRYSNYEDGTNGMTHIYATAVKIEKIVEN